MSILKRALSLAPVIIALVISVLPLLRSGFAMGHDWSFELIRVAEYRFALSSGQRPPFWAPDLYGGLGSPIFLFYAPLYLVASSLLVPFTHNVIDAATAALVLFSAVGMLLMWRLVHQVCPDHPSAARIAAILYVLCPYLLADKWIRNADAEFAALSIFPGVLIGATAERPRSAFWWTSLSLSGVILAHNITALTSMALAIAIPLYVHRRLHALVPTMSGVLVGLALSAFFWVPAFSLLPLIHYHDLVVGKFDFHNQFPELLSFIWPSQFYSPGSLTIPLLVVAILFQPAEVNARRTQMAFILASLVLVFLMLPASTIVWETIPLLRFAQFPWRFAGPLAILSAAAGAIAFSRLPRNGRFWWIEIIVLIGVILNAYPALQAYQPMPAKVRRDGDEALTPDGIARRKLSTTVYDEYLPVGALLQLHNAPPEEDRVLFEKWYFPVWIATVDDRPVPFEQSDEGLVSVQVQPGHGPVSLTLTEPPIRKWSKVISLITAALLFFVLLPWTLSRGGSVSGSV